MVEAVTEPGRHLPPMFVILAAAATVAHGHVLDEYLQSTLVVIEPGDIRLKINLTPGSEIVEKVLSQIDRDGDGEITSDESKAYAEVLRRDLSVQLDGRDTPLTLVKSNFPELADLRTGHGIIQAEFSLTASSFASGRHRLSCENRHFAALGVYLFNAARPQSTAIRIARQTRNVNQSMGEIEFIYSAPISLAWSATGILAAVAVVIAIAIAAVRRSNSERPILLTASSRRTGPR